MKTNLFCLGTWHAILLLGLSGQGCGASDQSTLILHISELSGDVLTMRLTATMAGRQTVKEYPAAPRIGLRLPEEARGEVDLLVNGLGAGGCRVSTGRNTIQALGEGRVDVSVPLMQCTDAVGCCSQSCWLGTPQDCGGCGIVCSAHHVTPVCNAGTCVGACESGYSDCDDDKQTNGCETLHPDCTGGTL
jgi:hypothetical protein